MLCWLLTADAAATCQGAVGAWAQHTGHLLWTPLLHTGERLACLIGMVELLTCSFHTLGEPNNEFVRSQKH